MNDATEERVLEKRIPRMSTENEATKPHGIIGGDKRGPDRAELAKAVEEALARNPEVPFPHLKANQPNKPHETPAPTSKYPDGNPKTAYGVKKPPSFYVPSTAFYEWALAHMHGALKYGHLNWRKDPVSASTYIDAMQRHLDLYKEKEDTASDSHVHHLAHVMACCAILIDAAVHGTLIDNRTDAPIEDGLEKFFAEKEEVVKYLQETWGQK